MAIQLNKHFQASFRLQWGLICWCTYCSAYLCRVNFSSAIDSLSKQTGTDYAILGVAGSAFFVVYAFGQLINGFIGDHVNPARFIRIAIVGTGLCNIIVALSSNILAVLIFWAANGYFQSIFWSTMIRALALVTKKKKQGSISAFISSAMPAGYLISWCILAPCFTNANAMWYFLIPALIALPMLLMWTRREKDFLARQYGDLRDSIFRLTALIRNERLLFTLIACIFHGLIKEGIAFWIPTIIRDATTSTLKVYVALALLPVANFMGTYVSKRLLSRFGAHPYRIVTGCFAAMLPVCATISFMIGIWVLIPMCIISMMSYCANTVLLSFIPMQYQADGFVASLVGMLDFSSYMGAAASTYLLGKMINSGGIKGIVPVWMASAIMVIILLVIGGKNGKQNYSSTVSDITQRNG